MLWPRGYGVTVKGGAASAHDAAGRFGGRVGGLFTVGGGEYGQTGDEAKIAAIMAEPLAADCAIGPYWVVSGFVSRP